MVNRTAKPKKTGKKPGPKSGYDPLSHPERAFKLAVLGCTDAEIAEQFMISEQQLNKWKVKYPAIGESIRAGKRPANSDVADALRQRAKGFEWVEEVPTKIKRTIFGENGKKIEEREEVVVTLVKRRVPPDTMAASLFLRNREKENWRDKVEVENIVKIEQLPDDKLESELIELYGKAATQGLIEGESTASE